MGRIFTVTKEARQILKEEGVSALFSRYGWKLVAVVFCYYLIRDVSLYILLPLVLVRML